MPAPYLRNRNDKHAKRLRIAMEMQRPMEDLRCGTPVGTELGHRDATPRNETPSHTAGENPARTTYNEVDGVPV